MIRVSILRKRAGEEEQYREEFIYDGSPDVSVAGLLEELDHRDELINSAGEASESIAWECSCLQGVCGACAMVINGRPSLACETFVRDLGDEISIEPLSKFPVIKDLITDRSVIYEDLKKVNAYIEKEKEAAASEYELLYSAAKCLKCGLCLEICPNYTDGGRFYGALFANECFIVREKSSVYGSAIQSDYNDHFAAGCSKSLACMDVCPMKIPTLSSMAKMNRKKKR